MPISDNINVTYKSHTSNICDESNNNNIKQTLVRSITQHNLRSLQHIITADLLFYFDTFTHESGGMASPSLADASHQASIIVK